MRHRHLDVEPGTPPEELGLAALDDLLDRGDLADWEPVLTEIRRNPTGLVADRVLQLVKHHPMAGTSALWESWIAAQRPRATPAGAGESLRRLRQGRGLTQQQVAVRLGMSQPEVSRLERRRDVRLSTLRSYVEALGGRLELSALFGDGAVQMTGERP